jgi:acyl carrier protein
MAKPNKQQITGVVCQAIAAIADVSEESLDGRTELVRDLNMDSLALYELVIDLEEHYRLQISDEDIDRIKTLDDIVSYIERSL